MQIIDAQIHEPLPWLRYGADGHDDDEATQNKIGTELVLAQMDAMGVQMGMISSTRRPAWGLYAIEAFAERFTLKTRVDPRAADVEETVANLRKRPGVLGIRVAGGFSPDAVPTLKEGAYDRVFAAAQRFDVPISINLPRNLPLVGEIARTYPDLTVIVEHVGIPQPLPYDVGTADVPRFQTLPDLLALAALPNVALKLTGLCTLSLEEYPFRDLWPPLEKIIEAFRPERLLWGSDNQRVQGRMAGWDYRSGYLGKHTYFEALAFIRDSERLSSGDKQLILAGTFRSLYRWPTAAPAV